jgi:hypothetical protein
VSDEQRLNSLDRFRKRPGRLILEVYSHCEVPAGCGGAVLRWRNPLAAVPVRVHLYTAVTATCFIDGTPLRTAGIDLAPGPHVVAVALETVGEATGLLMFAAVSDDRTPQKALPEGLTELRPAILSRGDGTWRYSLAPPAEGWQALGFDDRAWPALVRVPTPGLGYGDPGGYQCRRAAEAGAECLGLREPASEWECVWVRKVFEVPTPRQGG